MTKAELEKLGWEFDGEAPQQYGIRSIKDRTMYMFIVSKALAESWNSIHDMYSYLFDYKYKQGYQSGANAVKHQFKKLFNI